MMMTLHYATKATKFSDITIYFFSFNRTLRAVCMYVTTSGISNLWDLLFIIYFNSIPRRLCGCVCASAIFCTHKYIM